MTTTDQLFSLSATLVGDDRATLLSLVSLRNLAEVISVEAAS